jgi:hypothetical protein
VNTLSHDHRAPHKAKIVALLTDFVVDAQEQFSSLRKRKTDVTLLPYGDDLVANARKKGTFPRVRQKSPGRRELSQTRGVGKSTGRPNIPMSGWE